MTQIGRMDTDKIQINAQIFSTEEIEEKLNDPNLQGWEKGIFDFVLNWFDESDFILQKTSGSTGTPKEYKLKKSAMVASASKTINYFNLKKNDTVWLCLPIDYIAGKMMVVRALVGKLNLILTPPEGTPQIPNQTIDFASMVPLQLNNLIEAKSDLSAVKKLIIGGAAINYQLQQSIQSLSSEIYATYGMTETCSHIALQRLNGNNPDSTYKVLKGVTISANSEHCLRIDAPGITSKPLQTNDIVEIISPTEFKWLGRADNVINTGGIKVSPEELEKELAHLLGFECLIVPLPDPKLGQKLILVCEEGIINPISKKDLQELKKVVGKHRTPKAVYYLKQFPRNHSMKIDRNRIIQIINECYDT